jgi:hypothetical protein
MKSESTNLKRRRIHSFEPTPDVARFLDEARKYGFPIGQLINTALRRHLPKKLRVERESK